MNTLYKLINKLYVDELNQRHAPVLEILKAKKIGPKAAAHFELGVAGGTNDISKLLSDPKHFASKVKALESYIIIDGEFGLFDAFQQGITFPVHDHEGNFVGYIMKQLYLREADKKKAKYKNSSASQYFKKSELLYNMHRAIPHIKEKDRIILTEGPTDVIAAHQAGFPETVCSMGTSLTSQQAELISKYTTRCIIAYDGDPAGIEAVYRAHTVLSNAGVRVRVVIPSNEHDLNSYYVDNDNLDFISVQQMSYPEFEVKRITKYGKHLNASKDSGIDIYLFYCFNALIGATKKVEDKMYQYMAEHLKVNVVSIQKDAQVFKDGGYPSF